MNLDEFRVSLQYLYVSELQSRCESLALSVKGNKKDLINRIIHFLKTGEKVYLAQYPKASIAKEKNNPVFTKNALMLKGLYKNDLKNRVFLKQVVGEHFHFTAFGIDWLNDRWMQGRPPTYQEFADMWEKEYRFRKIYGGSPKEEWAYINFVKRYLLDYPNASRNEILKNWNSERKRHKCLVDGFLQKLN